MNVVKRPLIGITTGSDPDFKQPWKSEGIGQRREYIDAVTAAGGIPFLLPISTDTEVIEKYVNMMDGFLFAGGNDIDPVWYGEDNLYSTDLDCRRDAFEVRLLEQVEKTNKPVLAICRGMQVLNVARGGTLYQDIPSQLEGKEDHKHSDTVRDSAGVAHHLKLKAGSILRSILNVDEIATNSRHHQAIRDLGRGLTICAQANDGIVEAVEDTSRAFMVGIQSHPESMRDEVGTLWKKVFDSFIKASSHEEHAVMMHTNTISDDSSGDREEVSIFTA